MKKKMFKELNIWALEKIFVENLGLIVLENSGLEVRVLDKIFKKGI